jgi:hypothetical protein
VRKREPRSDNRNLRLGEHKPNDAKHGEEHWKTLWSRVPPALELLQVFRAATGRQMRRSPDGGITIKSAVAVFD